LTHEKLIPSVLGLVGELSDAVEKAKSLLECRTNEWLGNQRAKRFVLNFSELRLIAKQQHSLVWGDNQRDKEALIAASRHKCLINVLVYVVLPVLTMSSYGIWWLSPQGQIYKCESYLNDAINSDENEKGQAILQALTNNSYGTHITIKNLRITDIYQLKYFQNSIAEKITDERI
jgi:hypothetical protein